LKGKFHLFVCSSLLNTEFDNFFLSVYSFSSCVIDKSYLLDVFTKLYIATDSNPVDSHTYELCADLVELVIDVSCIYGLSEEDGAAIPYDQESSSAIRLNSGMVLYLREVSKYVALVCVIREENFLKRSVLDFNINCFRKSLDQVLRESSKQLTN
jgi:Ras-related GTP-binding protein C/D